MSKRDYIFAKADRGFEEIEKAFNPFKAKKAGKLVQAAPVAAPNKYAHLKGPTVRTPEQLQAAKIKRQQEMAEGMARHRAAERAAEASWGPKGRPAPPGPRRWASTNHQGPGWIGSGNS